MTDGDEVLSMALLRVGVSTTVKIFARFFKIQSNLHLVVFKILPSPAIKGIVEAGILAVHLRRHGPDGVLETHGRPQMRSRVERLEVACLVDDGDEHVLALEVGRVSILDSDQQRWDNQRGTTKDNSQCFNDLVRRRCF